MRIRPLLVAAVCAASIGVTAPVITAQVGPTLVGQCIANGGDARLCRSLGHLVELAGVLCRETGLLGSCTEIDGRQIDEALVQAHERSWLARALGLQRALDDDTPLQEELWVHTHNSYNADAYPQTVYGLDPNHLYTMTDQLRMDVRAIEIDMHWAESTSGSPADGGKAVIACHATRVPGGREPNVDVGCGVDDPLLVESLQEVRDWLDAEGNSDEVVMIYLEDQLDGDARAHELANAAIEKTLGDLVFAPPAGQPCGDVPMDMTRNEIRAANKRVLIASECDGNWSPWMHNRFARWQQSGLGFGDDYPDFDTECLDRRASEDYATNWIRHWGDETGLSNGAGEGGDVTPTDARNMVRCGVNMIGLDNLVPMDERLVRLVWSWAIDEPATSGCAFQGEDGFFHAGDCKDHRRFACRTPAGWTVAGLAGSFKHGEQRCAAIGATFDVPPNGWENELLKAAKGSGEVWLNYADPGTGWTPRP